MDLKAEQIALTRFGWIVSLVNEPLLPRGELVRRARAITARQREIGSPDTVCTATLLKWARRYRQHGLESLAPKPRADRGQWRAITPELAQLIERLKRENELRLSTSSELSRRPRTPMVCSELQVASRRYHASGSERLGDAEGEFAGNSSRPQGRQAFCAERGRKPADTLALRSAAAVWPSISSGEEKQYSPEVQPPVLPCSIRRSRAAETYTFAVLESSDAI
jgi:hypothetical protein